VEFLLDTKAPAPFHFGCGARIGECHALVVKGACLDQPVQCRLGVLSAVLAIEEAGAYLGNRVFPSRQHPKRVGVRGHGAGIGRYPPKRVISGAPLPTLRAISSRARSAVVEMPWTLSLNSSTFDAQRKASSSVTSPWEYRPKID
jgi:hypothetical protein